MRQTLWEIGALGDCTAEELSEGWKRPETERIDEVMNIGLTGSLLITFRAATTVAGRPAAPSAATRARPRLARGRPVVVQPGGRYGGDGGRHGGGGGAPAAARRGDGLHRGQGDERGGRRGDGRRRGDDPELG